MLSKELRPKLLGLFTICVLAYAIDMYLSPAPAPANSLPATLAVKSTSVSSASKVDVVVKKSTVRAYKQTAKVDLQLPVTVQTDETKVVTDSSLVASSEHRTEVTSVLDVSTGETSTYVHLVPDPWLSSEHRGTASLAYGIKLPTNQMVGRLSVREDLVQIKGIHLGIQATVDTDGDAFAGAGVSYRW